MGNFAIVTDSACDLPETLRKKHGIGVVHFKVSFDKVNKLTEGYDFSADEFYRKLSESGAMPKTYFPTVRDYVTEFKTYLERGQDVLCLCLSSKLSKSYVSAVNAKKIMSYNYPKQKIMVIDTLNASAGQSLAVLDAVRLSEQTDVTNAFNRLEKVKTSSVVIFTVATLDQLARGGRLSAAAAVFGSLLKINPIIYLSDGALLSKDKAIGRKKALDKVIKLTAKETGGKAQDYSFAMLHSRSLDEANAVANDLKGNFGITQSIPPIELGSTIGMHTGQGVVASAFVKRA